MRSYREFRDISGCQVLDIFDRFLLQPVGLPNVDALHHLQRKIVAFRLVPVQRFQGFIQHPLQDNIGDKPDGKEYPSLLKPRL